MLDMVGLHHVMYNGRDSGVPSYPSLIRGRDLPFHARIAKAADFISAVMPRHYRANGGISSLDGALAYAITTAGTELDPLAVACFITGFYDSTLQEALALVGRLTHPAGQEGVSDIGKARMYAMESVYADPQFADLVSRPAAQKQRAYGLGMEECAGSCGLAPAILRAN
jgi:hypothetical protein